MASIKKENDESKGKRTKKGITSPPLICLQPVALRQRGICAFNLNHEKIPAI
jgi:hypothetical protein